MKPPIQYSNQKFKKQSGMLIPLLIGVLAVFAIFILSLSQGSTSQKRQASLINHGTHSTFMGLGTIEEMHDIIWEKLSNPLSYVEEARMEVINACAGGGEYEMDLLRDLRFSNKIEKKQKKGKSSNKKKKKPVTAILKATARFHNFRVMNFSTTGLYETEVAYYSSPDGGITGQPAAGDAGTHQDWFGFVTYTVEAQHGIVTRTIRQTRGVKIVDAKPIAKDYVVFEIGTGGNKSLNEGEGLWISGNEEGRIRMDGPYTLDTDGIKSGLDSIDGRGGGAIAGGVILDVITGGIVSSVKAFKRGDATISGESINWPDDDMKWWDNSFIKPPKCYNRCNYYPPGRLLETGGYGFCIQVCCNLLPLGTVGSDLLGTILQPDNQTLFSSSIDAPEQNFSLSGMHPADGGHFNAFRGLLYQADGEYEAASGITETVDDWDVDKDQEVRHEGIIIGNYNAHKVTHTCFCHPVYCFAAFCINACHHIWWQTDENTVQDYYAWKGDEKPETDWLSSIISVASGVAAGFSAAGGSMAQTIGNSLISAGTQIANSLMGGMTGDALGAGIEPMNPEDMPNILPLGYRPLTYTATRHFPRLEDGMWKKNTLLLDGTLWVDEMNYTKKIQYIGKGSLITAPSQFAGEYALGELVPRNEKDWLNLMVMGNSEQTALQMNGDIEASVFSMFSVKPNKAAAIHGNLICETVHKDLFENDLSVNYWNEKLSEVEDFSSYLNLSISPKIEAYTDTMQALEGGTGDDGVQNIVEDL
jgi:hypothetical protein